jgi:uncharacterized protein DUF4357
MAPRGFTVQIHVPDGELDGLRIVDEMQWIGQCIVCPRARYQREKKRKEFARTGVYILVGYDGDDSRPKLYIGEGESVRPRLDSHHETKDFWGQVFVFTTKDNSLNKAHVKYLEARLMGLARRSRRCQLDNGNTPTKPGLSEADEANTEEYLYKMLLLMPFLGIDVFDSVPHTNLNDATPVIAPETPAAAVAIAHIPTAGVSGQHVYYLETKHCRVSGFNIDGGFVIRAGSLARGEPTASMASCLSSAFKERKQLIADGMLVVEGDHCKFTEDVSFMSASRAGDVCACSSVTAKDDWKDAEGMSLGEYEKRERRR